MNTHKRLIYFIGLCLIQIHCAQLVKIHRSICRRDVVFKAIDRDKKLTLNPSNILSTISASRLPLCTRHCTSTFNCRSLNYKQAQTANCQILDIDKSNASVVVENAIGWVHYEPVSMVRISVSIFLINFLFLMTSVNLIHSASNFVLRRKFK